MNVNEAMYAKTELFGPPSLPTPTERRRDGYLFSYYIQHNELNDV